MNAFTQGQLFRDEAINRVIANNDTWFERAMALIALPEFRVDIPAKFTGEDLTLAVIAKIGQPAHHNARGAVMMTLAKRQTIRKTGEFVQMKNPASHSRITPVYRWGKR